MQAPFDWRIRLRWQHWLLVIGIGLAGYFSYHAVNGSRGLLAWQNLTAELTMAEAELTALQTERRQLESKVARLRSDALDADLVDELARRGLSLVQPLDVIILLDQEHAPR